VPLSRVEHPHSAFNPVDLDLAKSIYFRFTTLHASGEIVVHEALRRAQVRPLFAKPPDGSDHEVRR
jgi:hypothetical protein